ncbi:hypothetical protein, partial [Pseudomonas aeruginosa]
MLAEAGGRVALTYSGEGYNWLLYTSP